MKLTTEEYVTKLKNKFGDKYDYSKVVYNGCLEDITIICKKHGDVTQKPTSFFKNGCRQCAIENANKKKLLGTENYIKKCINKFGNKYDYSKINYVNHKTLITIGCNKHGYYDVSPTSFIQNGGCKFCSYELLHEKFKHTKEEFVNKAIKIHGNKYNYDNVIYYNNSTNVSIRCNIHGNFDIPPNEHLKGTGCPKCRVSKKEREIYNFLVSLGFIENKDFYRQYKFDECVNYKTHKKLPFDFYLPQYNLCIEFDGYQHYTYPNRFHKTFSKYIHAQLRDEFKNSFCFGNHINLLRLREKDNIVDSLKKCFIKYDYKTKEIDFLQKYWFDYLNGFTNEPLTMKDIKVNTEAIEWLKFQESDEKIEELKNEEKEKILDLIKSWEEKYNCKW